MRKLLGLWMVMVLTVSCVSENNAHSHLMAPPIVNSVSSSNRVGEDNIDTPRPTATPAATATAVTTTTATTISIPKSATPAPTATPHPMSIESMRSREYPGSQIEIVKELTESVLYRRYYVSYHSDGLKIYALLTVPKGKKPATGWPAIVFLHGYIPPKYYQTTGLYTSYVDRLASAGYIVFRIDLRGHGNSEGEALGAYRDPGYTIDALNAVEALKSYPQADPQRIGMWGHSMGGYLTVRSMVISKDIRAGVSWAGVVGSQAEIISDWKKHTKPSPSDPDSQLDWQETWLSLYGTPEENPAFWDSISATAYLKDLSGPLLLIHSLQDEVVPATFSKSLAERIDEAGGEAQLILYPNDNHDIQRYFSTAMSATVAFFDQYLKK